MEIYFVDDVWNDFFLNNIFYQRFLYVIPQKLIMPPR